MRPSSPSSSEALARVATAYKRTAFDDDDDDDDDDDEDDEDEVDVAAERCGVVGDRCDSVTPLPAAKQTRRSADDTTVACRGTSCNSDARAGVTYAP